MKRSGFQRNPDKVYATLRRSAPIRSRRKRATVADGSKYLAACRGEPCYLRIPGVCRLNPVDHTVVPCHSNLEEHGKGTGLRAAHQFTFPGCDLCHFWLDQSKMPTKEARRAATFVALARWEPVRSRKMGLLTND
jgi:hypothetical protein